MSTPTGDEQVREARELLRSHGWAGGGNLSMAEAIEGFIARATQAEQERDAAEAARDEVFAVIERQHVQSSDQQVNEELHAARAEVVALRTALEEIEAHPVARLSVRAAALSIIARAALGSTTEPEETQTERIRGTTGRYPFPLVEESHTEPEETRGEADDVGRRPPTTTPNPSHMEARGGRPWDIFKRRAEPEEAEK